MKEIERHIFRQINKDISPFATNNGGDRLYLPSYLIDALNARYLSSEDGEAGDVENIRGNVLKSFSSLPTSGTNRVIGQILYNEINGLIYFVYNSEGNHQVILYRKEPDTFDILLSGSYLGFTEDLFIQDGNIIDDVLIWKDNAIRAININSALSGLYNGISLPEAITLGKKPPITPILITSSTLLGEDTNRLNSSSFRFAYRLIYVDNFYSTVGPQSKIFPGHYKPDVGNPFNNRLTLTVTLDEDILPFIKIVEFIHIKDNGEAFTVFESVRNPTSTTVSVNFLNRSGAKLVADREKVRLFDDIPSNPDSIEIIENRVVAVKNASGFDIEENYVFSTNVGTETVNYRNTYFKDGARHDLGLVFGDDQGRTTFVRSRRSLEFARYNAVVGEETWRTGLPNRRVIGFDPTRVQFIDWSLSGTPPAGFTWYQLVMTKNRDIVDYFQCKASPHLYQEDTNDPDTENPNGTEITYLWRGRKWLSLSRSGTDTNYRFVYFDLPLNTPFIPETGDFLRIHDSNFDGPKVIEIAGVSGEFLIIPRVYRLSDPERLVDWQNYPMLFIEVYKESQLDEDLFYEIGEVYRINNNQFSRTSGKVYGDQYPINTVRFSADDTFGTGSSVTLGHYRYGTPLDVDFLQGSVDIRSTFSRFFSPSPVSIVNVEFRTMDHNKIAWNYGRVHIENLDEVRINRYNSVVFSDPYIQNSNINGLNTFDPANEYSIAIERSPIRSLIKANDVLLAIHENETSSMYIREALIREGEEFVLVKTENFIGDDRELQFSYGTVNPESVKRIYGHVYWWDNNKGAVVRYTKAGLFPISNYGMRNYFFQKSREYEPYINQVKIITGYDYFHDEFLITFPDVYLGGQLIIEGVTWAFNAKEELWQCRYSFMPECYADINNDLYSFRLGEFWQHNVNDTYNQFYGTNYQRELRFYSNPRVGRIKTWLNIQVNIDYIYDGSDEEFKVVELKGVEKDNQQSFIPAYEFDEDNKKFYAPVLRDVKTPIDFLSSGQLALRDGDYMFGEVMEILLRSNRRDINKLRALNTVYKIEEYSK